MKMIILAITVLSAISAASAVEMRAADLNPSSIRINSQESFKAALVSKFLKQGYQPTESFSAEYLANVECNEVPAPTFDRACKCSLEISNNKTLNIVHYSSKVRSCNDDRYAPDGSAIWCDGLEEACLRSVKALARGLPKLK